MIDKREQILVRLREVIATVPGVVSAGRNREDVSGKARPAILLQDGSEELDESPGGKPPRRSGVQLMKMQPQFVVMIGDRTENVGTIGNQFRAALLTTIFNDDALIGLIGGPFGNGEIRYESCEFESQAGESREARMTVNMAFTYVLRIGDLS